MTTDAIGRPDVHFTAGAGWINDPLGLTFHGGQFHLFFQFAPGTTNWSPRAQWGHATSPDGLHWTEGPVALAPGDGDDGVWSGCVVSGDGRPARIFYTSVSEANLQVGRVRTAVACDDSWGAWAKGPVVVSSPPSADVVVFRDPQVFDDGDRWQMIVGAGLADGTATAFVYTSDDLHNWTYTCPLISRHRSETQPIWTGAVWECPQLFRIGDEWVLTVSVWEPFVPHYEAYAIGDYAEGRFTPRCWGRMTYGPSYYAGSTFCEPDGQRGLIYWLRGVDDKDGRWASALSVPHTVRIEGDRLVARPHPAIESCRVTDVLLEPRGRSAMGRVGPLCEIEWDAPVGSALSLAGDGGAEVARVSVSAGGVDVRVGAEVWTVPLAGDRIRLLVDGPILELFTPAGVFAAPLAGVDATLTVATTGHGQAHLYGLGVQAG